MWNVHLMYCQWQYIKSFDYETILFLRFDVVQMKDASIRAAENVLIENEAFQDIKEPATTTHCSNESCSSDSN